jgi:hypothetical protein
MARPKLLVRKVGEIAIKPFSETPVARDDTHNITFNMTSSRGLSTKL